MSTLNVNFALAIMLAILNFGSGGDEIRIDSISHATKRIDTIRIVPAENNKFYFLQMKQEEWLKIGEISSSPAQKGVFRFGELESAPSIDLPKSISDFESLTNPEKADVSFELLAEDKPLVFRQVRSAEIILLVDDAAQVTFVLHAVKPPGANPSRSRP